MAGLFKSISDQFPGIKFNGMPIMLGASVFVVLVCLSLLVADGWRSYSSRQHEFS